MVFQAAFPKIYSFREKSQKIHYILSFLLWPFGIMVAAFMNRKKKWAKNIFWLYCGFFGLTFAIASEGPDSARYANRLIEFNKENVTFSTVIKSLYDPETEVIDIVQPLITYIVSIFTNNPRILFGVFGLLFGYFYSRNVWYLLDNLNGKLAFSILVYMVVFGLLNPIWNINGIRMYTAMQVYIFGLMPYLMTKNKKSLLWTFSSILFHFSFIFPVLILLIYIFIGNRISLYFFFFTISIFIPSLDLEFVRDFLNFLPDFLQPRVSSYTDPYYAATISDAKNSLNWYLPLSSQILKWIVYLFTLVVYIRERKEINGFFQKIFCLGMWVYGWINIVSSIPSGNRFFALANIIMFFLMIIYLYYNSRIKIYRLIRNISIPFLVFYIIVMIRVGFDYMTVSTIIGNPLLTLFFSDNVPLIIYIKSIL